MSDGPDSPAPGPAAPASRPRVGGRLGRYELIDVVGHGAQATVFRARDTRLSREVALKVMNLVMAVRPDSAERFRREAHAVAAVKHPAIVEVFDFVAATDEDPAYIVSELILGPTLRRFVAERKGKLLPEAAALLLVPLCEALAAAHARGIVHRDLKPDNVMIERAGAASRIVLTDFGVAHVTGLETMTATGALVGSPAYMAPEQARGQDVGPAADLWAVGVMLYELVVGRAPFGGGDALSVLSAIARGAYTRAGQMQAACGAACDRIIRRALELDPRARHADAAALAEDLRALLGASGIPDEAAALRRFLQDPDAFEAELRPRVAAAAVDGARRHMRRAEIARALAEIGRAQAYVPDHAEAARLLASISTRRRWLRGAAVAGALAIAGGAGVAGWRALGGGGDPAPAVPAAGAVPAASAGAAAPPALAVAGAAPPAGGPGGAPATEDSPRAGEEARGAPAAANGEKTAKASARTRTPRSRAPIARVEEPLAPAPAAAAPVSAALPVAPEPAATAPTAPEPKPDETAAPAAARAKVTVRLSASYSWCYPALDDPRPSGMVLLSYTGVEPGPHTVYCAEGPTAIKREIGRIEISPPPPGRTADLHFVVKKPDDKGKVRVELVARPSPPR